MGCLWLYVLFWDLDFYRNDPAGLVMLVFWFVVGTIYLAVDLLLPAMVNSAVRSSFIFHLRHLIPEYVYFPVPKIPNLLQAHEPFETINKLRVNEETPGCQIQVPHGTLPELPASCFLLT